LPDWPITYAELEPYYTKTQGTRRIGPRRRESVRPSSLEPYPFLASNQSSGLLAEAGAKEAGMALFPAPMAIISALSGGRQRGAAL